MPFGFTISADTARFERELRDVYGRHLPFAGVLAATRSAQAAQGKVRAAMGAVFDRPVPFTLNALRLEPATRSRPQAAVYFREFAGKGTAAGTYLQPQVHGGPRRPTRFEGALLSAGVLARGEILVPARGFPLDAYGNVPRGLHQRILSQLKASRDTTQDETATSRRRRRRRGKSDFFFPRPGSQLPLGIYERAGQSRGIRGVMMVIRRTNYSPRFDFYGIGERAALEAFPGELLRALQDTARTGNFRGKWT